MTDKAYTQLFRPHNSEPIQNHGYEVFIALVTEDLHMHRAIQHNKL